MTKKEIKKEVVRKLSGDYLPVLDVTEIHKNQLALMGLRSRRISN